MKNKLLIIITLFNLTAIEINAQTIVGYSFEKYKIEKYAISKKAKLNFQSNPEAKNFKTRITEGYKQGKVDFGGYYITIIWGCGTGCINGAMVDIRDGKIYDLPLGEEFYYAGCFSNNENEQNDDSLNYKDSSRLFITAICSENEIENTNKVKQEKLYFVNVWNEQKKKFDLIKKIEKTFTKTITE
jgi:hypothetical protein